MLIHIVCWKYKPDTDEAARSDHRRRLSGLADIIPEIRRLDVGEDVMHVERSFDTALVAEFDDLEALERYDGHPAHREVVAIGREIAERAISVDLYRNA